MDAIRRVYAEWGRGNWQPKFDLYDPEMEWGWSDEFPAWAASIATLPNGMRGCASG